MRALVLWLSIHALVALLEGHVASFSPGTTVLVAALAAALSLIDLTVRHERIFMANLGISRRFIAVSGMATVVCGEIAMRIFASALAR